MSTKPQNVKGMRDLLPPAMMLRQHIIKTLSTVFERYGFEPLQTPVLEHAETLEGKLGDEERLIYRFEDHGGRKLAMRYDQTVPLARVVAQYQSQLQMPWRRYAIGASYRGERTQRGRYREFYQADIDIIGSASPVADAEIIAVLTDALTALGFDNFVTLLSHRQILGGIARVSGLDEAAAGSVYRAIDKLDKIGVDGVRTELTNSGVSAAACDQILHLVSLTGESNDVLDALASAGPGRHRQPARHHRRRRGHGRAQQPLHGGTTAGPRLVVLHRYGLRGRGRVTPDGVIARRRALRRPHRSVCRQITAHRGYRLWARPPARRHGRARHGATRCHGRGFCDHVQQ